MTNRPHIHMRLRPLKLSFGHQTFSKKARPKINENGAHNRIRTGDLFLTKEVLCRLSYVGLYLERVMGIEPTPSAWKAEVLPLNYTRTTEAEALQSVMVEGGGFEPPKAEPSDLQSDPFDRSGTPPTVAANYGRGPEQCQVELARRRRYR
jgi:hypothetical protein